MNEEEKELIDGYFNKGWCCDLDEVYNVVMKLEDLYQKEKEKNKELTDEYLIQRNLINAEFLNENYISKDKIREKMQQDIYTNEHTILGGRRHGKTLEYGIRLGRIQMCEELLEERK